MAGQQAPFATTMPVAQMGQAYKSMAGKLQQPLLQALEKKGYEYMSPVQEKVLKDLPSFQADCLVQAKTGTGKTIAFLLPTLHRILSEKSVPAGQVGVLIMSPTRELATQIKQECDMLTSQLQIECHTAFGGTAKDSHLRKFMQGKPTVLVATPGRLNDYLSEDMVAAKFKQIRTVILDEADTMLEAGFLPDITRILSRLPHKSTGWQGMCFSATIPEKMKDVLGRVLRPGYTHITTVDPNEVPTIEAVDQYSVIIPSVQDTFNTLCALIQEERQRSAQDFKAIVFCTTANGAGMTYDVFRQAMGREIDVYELHSRLSQSARTKTTEAFKKASTGIMFASDVIGRGMDFPNVTLVLQVGLPSKGEQYVHRVGRTARAGTQGRAIIMLTEGEKFFLAKNRQLPIKPYPVDIKPKAEQAKQFVQQALNGVDEDSKRKAYQAYLGYNKSFLKDLRLNSAGLVALANEFAAAMGCSETPPIDKMVVGKMGLRGTPGLNLVTVERAPRGRPAPKQNGAPQPPSNGRVEKPGFNGGRGGGRGGGGPGGPRGGGRGGRGNGARP